MTCNQNLIHVLSDMCILPPHSRMMPMILGCGIADLTCSVWL